VSDANEVPIQIIKQWIREERLSFSPDSAIGLECESCGKTIYTGRYCDACKAKMTQRLGNAYQKPAPAEAPKITSDHHNKMRFLNN
jgi:methionyl-tRNA synthetase